MALYYFIDAAGERKLIGSSNIRLTGAWSGATTYQVRDVATDGYGHYWMALVINTNVAIPSTFDSSVPTTWTHLVQAEASSLSPEDQAIAAAIEAMALSTAALTTAWVGTAAANAAGTLAQASYSTSSAALTTAWQGTALGHEAYDLARSAYDLAAVGTNASSLANEAYGLATYAISIAGTVAGGGDATYAYNIGRAGLETAWVGTTSAAGAQSQANAAMAVATAALTTAWAGTDAPTALAEQAQRTATAALETAWVGTNEPLAVQAMAVSTTALTTAWIGTLEPMGDAAFNLGRASLDTSWVGTGAASAAYNVAKAALEAAWAGTTAGSLNHAFTNVQNTFNANQTINGTLQVATTWNDVSSTFHALRVDITNTASSNTSSAIIVNTGNSEMFRVNKTGGLTVSGSYGVIGSASLGIGMEATGAYIQGFGGQPIFLQPIGNKIGLAAGATAPVNHVEIGSSLGLNGTTVQFDTSLGGNKEVVVVVDATSRSINLWLPAVASWANRTYTIKRFDTSANTVTVWANGNNERIESVRDLQIGPRQSKTIHCTNGTWNTVSYADSTTYGTLPPTSGTAVFNMEGPAWQVISLDTNALITVSNVKAPTAERMQTVTGLLSSTRDVRLTWDTFMWFGTNGPDTLSSSKKLLVSLAATGATVSTVAAAATTQY